MIKKAKFFPAIVVGTLFLGLVVAGCNNGDSTETKKDSTVVKTDTSKMMPMKDTTKMDTSAVKNMTDKPIVPTGKSSGKKGQ